MQIPKSENKFLPPPLPNPGNAPGNIACMTKSSFITEKNCVNCT